MKKALHVFGNHSSRLHFKMSLKKTVQSFLPAQGKLKNIFKPMFYTISRDCFYLVVSNMFFEFSCFQPYTCKNDLI